MRLGRNWAAVLIVAAASTLAWALLKSRASMLGERSADEIETQTSPIFTPGHRSVEDAVKEFFNVRPALAQPIAFNHRVHLANRLQCADCHTAVGKGPQAGLPSVKLCMTCHEVIATGHPEIKKMAAYASRGEDLPWRRVYDFNPSAHVKFNHAPHLRAKVACATCHGDLTQQTVALRAVELNMGYCINCHKLKMVSIDCTTCHF